MTKRRKTIATVAAGVLASAAIVGGTFAAWFFASAVDLDSADAAAADASFREARRRSGDGDPVFLLRGSQLAITRPPAPGPPAPPATLHALAWDPDDEGLTRVVLPFWFLRLKSGPIDLMVRTADFRGRLDISVEEVARYGPTLLLDHGGDGGGRLLVWTE